MQTTVAWNSWDILGQIRTGGWPTWRQCCYCFLWTRSRTLPAVAAEDVCWAGMSPSSVFCCPILEWLLKVRWPLLVISCNSDLSLESTQAQPNFQWCHWNSPSRACSTGSKIPGPSGLFGAYFASFLVELQVCLVWGNQHFGVGSLPGSSSSEVFLSLRFICSCSDENASKMQVCFPYLVSAWFSNLFAILCYLKLPNLWRCCAASLCPNFVERMMFMKIINAAFLSLACVLPVCLL